MKQKMRYPFQPGIMIAGLLLMAVVALAGCGPAGEIVPTLDPNQIATSAAQTVIAALTNTALAQPTATLEPTATETMQPTATLEPTMTPTEGPTNTATSQPTSSAPIVHYTVTPSVGVSISATSLAAGESFTATVYGFPKSADIDVYLEEVGSSPSVVLDGKTDSNGAYSATLTMPSSAAEDEKWVVVVTTTELSTNTSATSAQITIVVRESTSTPTGATVTVSSTSLGAGDSFTVTVSGFPKNANIDFQLGIKGEAYSAVADGLTDANGATSVTMTIPSSANKGEKWVVTVMTTEIVNGVTKTSATITITD